MQTLIRLASAILVYVGGFITDGDFAVAESTSVKNNNKTQVMIISGGSKKSSNNYRYENNVQLFHDILLEHGYDATKMVTLFNEGKDSEVRDVINDNPAIKKFNYGIKTKEKNFYRKTILSDLIDGPADNETIQKYFEDIINKARNGEMEHFVLYTTDHGTAHEQDYSKSYITLSKKEKLEMSAINSLAAELSKNNVGMTIIGTQCFSGANMGAALENSNVCSFSSSEAFEVSYAFPDSKSEQDKFDLAPLSFSEYAFHFSCALHRGKKDTFAGRSCQYKDKKDADFDGDKKVSFAEAHYYALYRESGQSAPQISSQKYAVAVYRKLFNEDEAGIENINPLKHNFTKKKCLKKERRQALDQILGDTKALALKINAKNMLAMKKKYLSKILDDSDLLKFIEVEEKESIDVKIAKINEYYRDYQRNYQQLLDEIKKSLKKIEKMRKNLQKKRSEFIEELSAKDQSFKQKYEKFLSIDQELRTNTDGNSNLLMIEHHRLKSEVDRLVDKQFTRKHGVEETVLKETQKYHSQLVKQMASREGGDVEDDLHKDHAMVRKAYQLAEGYLAEKYIIEHGSEEEVLKLANLYSCENKSLDL